MLARNPGADLCLFVDDIALLAVGRRQEQVTRVLEEAMADCIATLEVGLGMTVSRGSKGSKTIALHSSLNQRCSKKFAKNMGQLGVKVARHAKLLGVDFSAGKKIQRSVQRKRIVKICHRRKRYRQLGTRGASHVTKTGAGPGFKYGSAAFGATNSAIKVVRSFSCNALGEMRGKSTFARLVLAGYDAGGLMATEPVVQWAKAIWDKLVSPEDMAISWRAAMNNVAGAARPFSQVRGPAGAMVASARRIGWEIPSPLHLRLENGAVISVATVAPRDIQLLAERALRHKEAPNSSLAARTGVVPDLEPLKCHLHAIRRTSAAASLRSLGEGGWWTQDRMYAASLHGVTDDVCKACDEQVGTLYHRCCGCSSLLPLMRNTESQKHQSILGVAQSAIHHQEPLFQHGFPELQEPLPPPPMVMRWCGGVEVGDFQFAGDVFSDGSVRTSSRKGHERAGWAAVMINSSGLVIGGVYGTCPDFFATSLRAELWAVLQVLRHACPPITIWCDTAGVVDGFQKGASWCCNARRPAVDLWHMIWCKVDDLGGDGILIRKVKGHATMADVQAGRCTAWHRGGNSHADWFACRGSMLAEELSSTSKDRQIFKQARAWYSWLTLLVANWPADTSRGSKRRTGGAGGVREHGAHLPERGVHLPGRGPEGGGDQGEGGLGGVREHGAHVPARGVHLLGHGPDGGGDQGEGGLGTPGPAHDGGKGPVQPCEAGRGAKLPRQRSGSRTQPALPEASSARSQLGRGHQLYRSGALVWCSVCGAYAEQRFKSLKEPCGGAAGRGMRAGQLGRLRKGEHPLKKGERLPRPVRFSGLGYN